MADRPVFKKVFEEDESTIRNRMLSNPVLAEWRREPGDYVYDTIATSPPEIKQLQVNQDFTLKNGFPQYAEGEYLAKHLEARGMKVGDPTPNRRNLSIVADAGVSIAMGQLLSVVITDPKGNPYEFTVDEGTTWTASTAKTIAITCKSTGAATNIPNGSQFILKPPLPGVRQIIDLGTTIPGADRESDASAWARYDFALSHPDTGGNKNDYVRWAMDNKDVGKVRCIPRWNGVNTVKVVVVDKNYQPAAAVLVEDVQNYLDPGITGLGDGKAPCGAWVTVVAATGLPINISATVTYAPGYTSAIVKPKFSQAVVDYLKTLVFTDDAISRIPNPVLYNQIFALLTFTEGVSNFTNLKVNDGTSDIAVTHVQAPILGVVNI